MCEKNKRRDNGVIYEDINVPWSNGSRAPFVLESDTGKNTEITWPAAEDVGPQK
jgi:hypothetical protein